jgi:hypothetical protein
MMAKRKKGSKVQKRAKLRRGNSTTRNKAHKVSKSARGKATKLTVASAKSKRATVKKPARKEVERVKQPPAPAIETVTIEAIEDPPGVITVLEVDEVVVRKESPGPG